MPAAVELCKDATQTPASKTKAVEISMASGPADECHFLRTTWFVRTRTTGLR